MKRAINLQAEYEQIGTIEDLTSVFEAIASIHIAQIKDKVMTSTAFFNELWHIYTQIRTTKDEYHHHAAQLKKNAIIVITSEGGLIGDIDERIVKAALEHEELAKADVYVIGSHGSTLFTQHGIKPLKAFQMPETDEAVNVTEMAAIFGKYSKAIVYYQTYISLAHQEAAKLDLFSAVSALGSSHDTANKDIISSKSYTFEPSIKDIVTYMESVMLEIALAQVVLESKLAQYASRFNAMYNAKSKAKELKSDMSLQLHRTKRAEGDERLKEIFSTMKALGRMNG